MNCQLAQAQWILGTASDNLVDTGYEPILASDGNNGAFVLYRKPGNLLLLQRYNAQGVVQWTNPLTLFNRYHVQPIGIIPDGANGVYVTWIGCSTSFSCADKLYAQRISASGMELWTSGGLALNTGVGIGFLDPQLTIDSAQNLYIAYEGVVSGGGDEMRVMKLNNQGLLQWQKTIPNNFVGWLSNYARSPQIQYHPTDQALYLSWRGVLGQNYPIALFKLATSDGTTLWSKDLGGSANSYANLAIDLMGGVGLTWGYLNVLEIAKVEANGNYAWSGKKSIPNVDLASGHNIYTLQSDGNGGFFNTWADKRSGNLNGKVMVQHYNATGNPSFGAGGMILDSLKYFSQSTSVQMVKAGTGNVIVISASNSQNSNNTLSLKASKVGTSGKLWSDLSRQFTAINRNNTGGSGYQEQNVIEDGRGGFIAGFTDTSQGNIYLKRLNMTGTFTTTAAAELPQNVLKGYPNPTNGILHLTSDKQGNWVIYDILGREILHQMQDGFEATISLEKQVSGVYFAQFTDVEGKIYPPISVIKW